MDGGSTFGLLVDGLPVVLFVVLTDGFAVLDEGEVLSDFAVSLGLQEARDIRDSKTRVANFFFMRVLLFFARIEYRIVFVLSNRKLCR